MTLLDVSITNVALPSIGRATLASPAQLQWVVSGYTLAFGLVPVLAGRLGDDHGRRLMFQVGVVSFALTSVLCGLAPTAGVLIAARILQGVAGGLINPQVSGLVQHLFRSAERGRAFGVLGTTVGVGTALGPLVGGSLIAAGGPEWGWRLVFFINVPVGVAVILVARRTLPTDRVGVRQRLDLLGAALLGAAVFGVLFAAVEYDAVRDWRLFLLVFPAILLFGLFLGWERRLTRERRDPLIDLKLLARSDYRAGLTAALAFFPATAGIPLVLALYYQDGLGYSALQAGLGVTAYALGSAVSAPLSGRVVLRIGRALLLAGVIAFGVGALALIPLVSRAHGAGAALLLAPALFVMGAGAGAFVSPNQALTLRDVDPLTGATAGGVLQTAQRIGLAIGQSVIGAVFFAAATAGGPSRAAYVSAMRWSVLAALGFVAAAAAIGVADLRRGRDG